MQQLNGKQASLTIAEWAYEDSGAAIQVGATGVDEPHDEQRPADAGNPRGYFEYAPIKTLGAAVSTDQRWLTSAGGHAIKVIAQLLPKLPSGRRCRILFMEHPLSEVVASQRQMLKQLGKDGAHSSDRRLASAYLN